LTPFHGAVSATYEYGAFGEVIRSSGTMAKINPLRFSTKYQDDESDMLYYGYRYYNPSTGRWLSRDPIGENGGLNIYAFVGNGPLDATDSLGQDTPKNGSAHSLDSGEIQGVFQQGFY